MSTSHEISVAAVKASPPLAVAAAAAGGLSLEEWVFIITLFYLVLQISYLLWKWIREARSSDQEAS